MIQKEKAIDETEGLQREYRERKQYLDAIDKYQSQKEGERESIDSFSVKLEAIDSEENKAYRKRTEHQLQICFKSVEGYPDWSVGWYMHLDFNGSSRNKLILEILGFYLNRFFPHVSNIYLIAYSSVVDDGDISRYYLDQTTARAETYVHLDGEHENWKMFSERVQQQYQIPITNVHKTMECFPLEWQYHLIWKAPQNQRR